ncbi:MAG TPA: 4-hydroxy-tetrahydrodipicolinate reductase [Actinomycetes bacterium]|nr:4-hydroxy-tetrahydrodipicolinate reductase [Actinomycetes bacterium]
MTRVVVAGATGWTGRAIVEGVLAAPDLELIGAVARSAAGQDLGVALGRDPIGVTVSGAVDDALDGAQVLVDFTSHEVARDHTLTAVAAGVHVVVGSSGLTAEDYAAIDQAAREAGVGVVAAGNFSLTAAMAQAAALLVAPHLPRREIVDYASAGKADAPSGTARELAERLGEVAPAQPADVAVADTSGLREARGATIAGTQVHSVRLPSFVVSTEVVFALPDERLVIRHDAGPTPQPYVAGTLLAIRAAPGRTGLVRGLDTLLLSRGD